VSPYVILLLYARHMPCQVSYKSGSHLWAGMMVSTSISVCAHKFSVCYVVQQSPVYMRPFTPPPVLLTETICCHKSAASLPDAVPKNAYPAAFVGLRFNTFSEI
jgi:hypothetical protein